MYSESLQLMKYHANTYSFFSGDLVLKTGNFTNLL